MELNKSNIKKILLIIVFAVAFYLGLKNINYVGGFFNALTSVLSPIIVGMALAFIMNVLLRQVENHIFSVFNKRCHKIWPKIKRPISIFVTILIILGLITIILLIMIPEIQRTILKISDALPPFITNVQELAKQIQIDYPITNNIFSKFDFNIENISKSVENLGTKFGSQVLGSTVSFATGFVNGIITAVFAFIFALEILSRKEKLKFQAKRFCKAYIPKKFSDKFLKLCSLTNTAFYNFIVGQCTEACILGCLVFIGMKIFGFPYAPLISVFVAFMALIPIFGAFFSATIGALLILVDSPIKAFWFVVFFIVLQQLEGNLIYPRVVGSRVGLPPLWVLAAITIGGNLFGLIGMLVFIPIFSVIYVVLREDIGKRLSNKLKQVNQKHHTFKIKKITSTKESVDKNE